MNKMILLAVASTSMVMMSTQAAFAVAAPLDSASSPTTLDTAASPTTTVAPAPQPVPVVLVYDEDGAPTAYPQVGRTIVSNVLPVASSDTSPDTSITARKRADTFETTHHTPCTWNNHGQTNVGEVYYHVSSCASGVACEMLDSFLGVIPFVRKSCFAVPAAS